MWSFLGVRPECCFLVCPMLTMTPARHHGGGGQPRAEGGEGEEQDEGEEQGQSAPHPTCDHPFKSWGWYAAACSTGVEPLCHETCR